MARVTRQKPMVAYCPAQYWRDPGGVFKMKIKLLKSRVMSSDQCSGFCYTFTCSFDSCSFWSNGEVPFTGLPLPIPRSPTVMFRPYRPPFVTSISSFTFTDTHTGCLPTFGWISPMYVPRYLDYVCDPRSRSFSFPRSGRSLWSRFRGLHASASPFPSQDFVPTAHCTFTFHVYSPTRSRWILCLLTAASFALPLRAFLPNMNATVPLTISGTIPRSGGPCHLDFMGGVLPFQSPHVYISHRTFLVISPFRSCLPHSFVGDRWLISPILETSPHSFTMEFPLTLMEAYVTFPTLGVVDCCWWPLLLRRCINVINVLIVLLSVLINESMREMTKHGQWWKWQILKQ